MSGSIVAFDVGFNRSGSKNWFAVFTAPRHEKKVEEHLRLREIESFLPLYEKQRQWKDRSKGLLRLPLFPSYLFAHFEWHARISVLAVPGVISIVSSGREPLPVPDSYIQFLQECIREKKIEPHPYLVMGTRVRIRVGVMAGMEGVLVRKKASLRVVLSLEAIMKSVTVEVGIDEIETVRSDSISVNRSGRKPSTSELGYGTNRNASSW
jgi:transcription antitermination factor NusG